MAKNVADPSLVFSHDTPSSSPSHPPYYFPHGGSILQLSGSDCSDLINAASVSQAAGYDAININMGCPASSAQKSLHGAALMLNDNFFSVFYQVKTSVSIPVSIKCRLGVDTPADYSWFWSFIRRCVEEGGCEHFIIHSRVALLDLKASKNINIPPIRADFIYRLRKDLDELLATSYASNTRLPSRVTLEFNGQVFSAEGGARRSFGLPLVPSTPAPYLRDDISFHSQLSSSLAQLSHLSRISHAFSIVSTRSSLANTPSNSNSDLNSNSIPPVPGVMVGRGFMRNILYGVEHDAAMSALAILLPLPLSSSTHSQSALWSDGETSRLVRPSAHPILGPTFSRIDLLNLFLCSLERVFFQDQTESGGGIQNSKSVTLHQLLRGTRSIRGRRLASDSLSSCADENAWERSWEAFSTANAEKERAIRELIHEKEILPERCGEFTTRSRAELLRNHAEAVEAHAALTRYSKELGKDKRQQITDLERDDAKMEENKRINRIEQLREEIVRAERNVSRAAMEYRDLERHLHDFSHVSLLGGLLDHGIDSLSTPILSLAEVLPCKIQHFTSFRGNETEGRRLESSAASFASSSSWIGLSGEKAAASAWSDLVRFLDKESRTACKAAGVATPMFLGIPLPPLPILRDDDGAIIDGMIVNSMVSEKRAEYNVRTKRTVQHFILSLRVVVDAVLGGTLSSCVLLPQSIAQNTILVQTLQTHLTASVVDDVVQKLCLFNAFRIKENIDQGIEAEEEHISTTQESKLEIRQ